MEFLKKHPPEWDAATTPSESSNRMAQNIRRREVIETMCALDKRL
jgi:hypothetical protein